jgi:cation:H+ antiporter
MTGLLSHPYLALIAGLACAGAGGYLFVEAILGFARWARVSPGIVGATLAAFATSAPELTVVLTAAQLGHPAISLGNLLGSNVMNLGLIVGLSLASCGGRCRPRDVRWHALATMLAAGLTALWLVDGGLSRVDGGVLLAGFAVWLAIVVRHARRERAATVPAPLRVSRTALLLGGLGGLVLLAIAGRLIVFGAEALASAYQLDEVVIGAIVVAFGTSAPELITALIAAARGHGDVALGTTLGSVMFNGLFLGGLLAVLSPFSVELSVALVPLGFAALLAGVVYPPLSGELGRRRGLLLLLLYAAYLATIIQLAPSGLPS